MVFLPPDQTVQSQNPYNHAIGKTASYSPDGKIQPTATTQDQLHCPTHAGDNLVCAGASDAHYPEQQYSYHYTPQSMILVQVNPGETFTIQAEDGTQCIQGPAQVPMVSPNGAIPPIHVPHGYISQVIEEHGLRRVVVIPERPHAHFTGSSGGPPIPSQQPQDVQNFSMQAGPHLNYMQQMNMMPLNQQTAMYPAGEHHLPVLHQPLAYVRTDGSMTSENASGLTSFPQHHQHQFHIHPAEMDPASSAARANKAKERLQKKLHKRHQQPSDSEKNPSPTSASSISPSSSSSYAATPSPNSSPDSSPRILGSAIPLSTCSNGYKAIHPYVTQQQLLGSPQHYQQQQQYPSPAHSPSFINSGNNTYRNCKNQPVSHRANAGNDMSSGSSSSGGGSPRRVPAGAHRPMATSQDMANQFQANPHQQDITFHSSANIEPFPNFDDKKSLKEFLSAISKPEIYDTAPRSVQMKWTMRFSFPLNSEWVMKEQKIIYEVFLSDKGKEANKFKSKYRDTGTFFLLKDLKPGVEYHTKVLAELNSVKGNPSEVTTFRTLSCPPDTPGAPKLLNRTKNSLTLKWAAPHDNGEKILKYHIEWDEGKKGSGFRSLYSDIQKQHKVVKLQPSHNYTFRLNSVNKMGTSPWSPEVTYCTAGTAPSAPDPPRLSKAAVKTLTLTWSRVSGVPGDSSVGCPRFTLEMDDVAMGYGFRAVYDGNDSRAQVKNLNRSSQYNFRLCSYNNEGKSNFSEVATYWTLPDKPCPPGKVVLKGKALPTKFKVAWDQPKDNGGADIAQYVLECCHERGQQMSVIYSGLEREFTLENTEPGLPCRLRVFCVSDGGTSMPSEVTVIVPPPVTPGPCAPPRLASKAKPHFLSLRWDPPNYNGGSNVTSYEVAMDPQEQDTEHARSDTGTVHQRGSLKQVYHGPGLDHSVSGLKPGRTYKFLVRAANKVGTGQWSDIVELETSPGPPEKPDAPEADTVTSFSILLTWKKPHDNGSEVTGYAIEWGCADSSMNTHQLSSCLFYNFQQVLPDSTYFFRIQAQNDFGKSAFSDVLTVDTPPSCPGPVQNVWQGDLVAQLNSEKEDGDLEEEVIPNAATSAMVQWEVPITNGSEIKTYLLEVIAMASIRQTRKKSQHQHQSLDEDPTLIEVDSESPCHLLQDLQPDSEYRIRVKAVNSIGPGGFSLPTTIQTQPLPPDPPVIECACSYNSLKLKWGDSDSFNNTYLLQMREKHGRFVTIYNGSSRTYRVNRLSERMTYHFRINSRNHAGEGQFSTTYAFTTLTAPPAPLRHLPTVNVKQEQHVLVTWEELEPIKGDPVSYIINAEDCEDVNWKQSLALDDPFYRFGPLVPGRKYKVQVAAVRKVCATRPCHATHKASETMRADIPSQHLTYNGADVPREDRGSVDNEDDNSPEVEEIIGNFTNWVTFEVPIVDSFGGDASSETGTKSDFSSGHPSLLKVPPVAMSDERKAVIFLATFFLFAVVLAFLVQFLFN